MSKNKFERLKQNIQRNNILFALIASIVIFSVINNKFFTIRNIVNMAIQNAPMAVVSVGITFALISGNIDISVGSLVALAIMVFGFVFKTTGNLILAVVACFITAILSELLNGLIVAKAKVNAMIVTLSAMIWGRGLATAITKAESIIIQHPFINTLGSGTIVGIPCPIIVVILSFLLGWYILNYTKMGTYIYGLGENEVYVRRAGINVDIYKILIFGFTGIMLALASLLTISWMGVAQVNAAMGLEMDAIAAAIIGGNSMYGGKGGIGKTVLGVLFLMIITNGISNLGLPDSYISLLKGLIILVALFIEVMSKKYQKSVNPAI